jgi:hypothetical protein
MLISHGKLRRTSPKMTLKPPFRHATSIRAWALIFNGKILSKSSTNKTFYKAWARDVLNGERQLPAYLRDLICYPEQKAQHLVMTR